LYLGRLSEEKGVRQILSIAESAPDLRFCIAGDGVEREYLEVTILKRNIRNVELVGWQLPSVCLPHSRVLLLPSKYETFGIVIIESWLHGVPVVAFEGADGPRELLKSMYGGGLVKDYGNDSEWIARIREQLLNPLSDDFTNQTLQRYSAFEIVEAWL
jgi:glycosyltransferase involved in cell wall biosynthesis